MPVRFNCENCDVRIKVPDGSEGKKVKCPSCGHAQRVPGVAAPVTATSNASRAAAGRASTSTATRPPAATVKAPVKHPVAATSATPPKAADRPRQTPPPPKSVKPPAAPLQQTTTDSVIVTPEPSSIVDPLDALAALAAAGSETMEPPPAVASPSTKKPMGENRPARPDPSSDASAPAPAAAPIIESRRHDEHLTKPVETAASAPASSPAATAPVAATTPPDRPSGKRAAKMPKSIPLSPPPVAAAPADLSALDALRAAMEADESAVVAPTKGEPTSIVPTTFGTADSASPAPPTDAAEPTESLAEFFHSSQSSEDQPTLTAADDPAAAPPAVTHASLFPVADDPPTVTSAPAEPARQPSAVEVTEPAAPIDDADQSDLDLPRPSMPLSISASEPLDGSEAPAGEVRELFDDFVRREEQVRQEEEDDAAAGHDEPTGDRLDELAQRPQSEDESDPVHVSPSPVIVTRSVPRPVRSTPPTAAPPAVEQPRNVKAQPSQGGQAVDIEAPPPPPRAIPLSRSDDGAAEPEQRDSLPFTPLVARAAVAVDPPVARPRRAAAPPAYSLLLVLCWTLRVLACLSLGSIAKLLLIWSDAGAKLTDVLIAIPLGLGIAGGIWAIGEVARVARDAARNSHR